ncbi:MAG: DNA polymerase III subunit gamma/tau [Acidobacteria bacterium]|nr:MAG: DNA polymerase III subunit gamma/tau [Acidobacteriota bacterium]
MSYQVLARKWRPQVFEEVTGQETVTKTLQNAITSGRIAHAFLFSGVRGVGKTTTARILAKALNCHDGPTPRPCGQCVSCTEIAASGSVDVLEIDAASNRRIDDVRELRESVRYGTARDRFKIFIIDEVHMLTNEAFNALLKTLEEPPAHVKLILATTEHHKIPVTITSRCQQYDFKPIPFNLILDRLRLICGEEGIEVSDYGLRAVTSISQGSMRDAQSTLDRVIAFAGRQITDDDVRSLLGVVDEKLVSATFEAILNGDRGDLIRQTRELADQGIEPLNFCRKLVEHVRNLMVCRVAGWETKLVNLPDTEKEIVLGQAEKLSEIDLIRFYDVLSRTESDLRWHLHPAIHLEMTLVKLIELSRLPLLEDLIGQLQAGGSKPMAEPANQGSALRPEPRMPAAARPAVVEPPPTRRKFRSDEDAPAAPAPLPSDGPEPGPYAEPDEQIGGDPVHHLLTALQQQQHHRVYGALHEAENNGSLRFQTGMLHARVSSTIHANTLQDPANQQIIKEQLFRIVGTDCGITIEIEGGEPERRQDPTEHPGVRSLIEKYPGKIIVQRKMEN